MPTISVTKLINQYKPPFDSQAIAHKVAEKEGKSVAQVLKEWEQKRDAGMRRGNALHRFAEHCFNIPFMPNFHNLRVLKAIERARQAEHISDPGQREMCLSYRDFLQAMSKEYTFGLLEKDVQASFITGKIDLFIRKMSTGNYAFIDYKTSQKFTLVNDFQSYLKPLEHLADSHLTAASLQLNLYRWLALQMAKFNKRKGDQIEALENAELAIILFRDGKWEWIDALDLQSEVNQMVDTWRGKSA